MDQIGSLGPKVVTSDRVLSMDQIDLLEIEIVYKQMIR